MAARNRLYAVFLGNPVQPGLERRRVGRYQAALPRECRDLTRAGHRPSKRAETTDRQGKTDANHCSHSSSPRAHRISRRRTGPVPRPPRRRASEAGILPGVVARRSNIAFGRGRLPEHLPFISTAVRALIADPFVLVLVAGRRAREEGRRAGAYHVGAEIGSILSVRN